MGVFYNKSDKNRKLHTEKCLLNISLSKLPFVKFLLNICKNRCKVISLGNI